MISRYKKIEGKQLIYHSYDELLRLWCVDKKELDVDTSFGKTHVITSGRPENPPVILFHGVGDDSAIMWIYNIKELVVHFFVIAIDTIGGPGKSEPNERYFMNFEQSLWIDEILDFFNINKTNIIGVSNGSYIAQYYSIKKPERVNKVICMAGSIITKKSPNPIFRMMKVFLPEALFPTKKNVRKLLAKMCGPNYNVFTDNPALFLHWYYLLKYFNNKSMMYHKLTRFTSEEIATLRDKSIFLIGDSDRLVYHPNSIDALTENNLNYQIIEKAGHGINHEQSDIINKIIVHYLVQQVT